MTQAVILAGGAGTRLRPLTLNLPKPMIDVNGRPFLLFIVEELKKHGIKDLVFCVGYLSDKFKDFFGDGSKFGVRILYSIEEKFIGTGGALRLAKRLLENDFFVINGDTYLPIDYAEAYKHFKRSNKCGMLVLYDNHERIAEPNIAIDKSGNVNAYEKKESLKRGDEEIPKTTGSNIVCKYVDAGVQVFKKTILKLMFDDEYISLEVDLFPELIARRDLAAYVVSQRYYDLGTPERLDLIRKVLK